MIPECAALTHVGLVRQSNQDVARSSAQLGFALVADGMGGTAHGDVASRTAADTFEQTLAALGGIGRNLAQAREHVERAFQAANRQVGAKTRDDELRSGTTLVVTVIAHGHAIVANVGDSRCYRCRRGQLSLLTVDHSVAELIRRSPVPLDIDASRHGHMLTRAVTGETPLEVDVFVEPLEDGDLFVLCSDGLWGMLEDDVIEKTVTAATTAEDACRELVRAACLAGGRDNVGVAVMTAPPAARVPTRPPRASSAPKRPVLDAAAATRKGRERDINEDVARVDLELGIAVVADGLAGHLDGEIASAAAVAAFEQHLDAHGTLGRDVSQSREVIERAIARSNAAVAELSAARQGTMSTTLVVAAFAGDYAVVAHLGDSRCYRIRGAEVERITHDHSIGAELRRASTHDHVELAAPHWDFFLTRAVDGSADARPDVAVASASPGDVFVLCTDGVWRSLDDRTIQHIVSLAADAASACDALVDAAHRHGGDDDVSVAVVRVVG